MAATPTTQHPGPRVPSSHRLRAWLRGDARTPAEIRDAVYLFEGDAPAKQGRFWLLLILATAIATAGVIGDSTATVIGAMIVAPLAIPIQGVAVAIATGDAAALAKSATIVVLAAAVVVALGALIAVILPELEPLSENTQVTARINPTLVDLVAASATGLAGAFAVSRRDIADILPGVAIAISLVPPLCVVGVTAVAGDWVGSAGALLLFLTNVLAMIVLGAVVTVIVGAWEDRPTARTFGRRRVYAVIGIAGGLVVAALAATTAHTVRLAQWQAHASDVARSWASERGDRFVGVRVHGDHLSVLVSGIGTKADDRELVRQLGGRIPEGTHVLVIRVPSTSDDAGQVETTGA